jgi:tetratricopeptide (TPR) repeat protein
LNIKFSQKKKELREDPVIETFFQTKEFVLKNLNMLVGTAIVLAFAVVVLVVYSWMRSDSLAKAEAAFGIAMIEYSNRNIEKAVENFRIVADNHRNTPQGTMSSIMLGSIFLSMGRHDDAIKWFEVAAPKKGELGFLGAQAFEGLAAAFEAKGDVPKALEYLEKALRDDRAKYRHAAVRWKMALLNQKIKNAGRAETLCREILSDTTASDYRQQAENLLAVLGAGAG